MCIAQTELSIDSISNYIGYHVKICDKVSTTYQSTNPNKVTYIHFGGEYPDQKFSVIIFPRDLENFEYNPSEYLLEKNVCVTGMSSEYKGKPQMIASFSDQITILD